MPELQHRSLVLAAAILISSACSRGSQQPSATPPRTDSIPTATCPAVPSEPEKARESLGQQPVLLGGVENDDEHDAFANLLEEANSVLVSRALEENLLAVGRDYPSILVHFLGDGTPNDPRRAVNVAVDQLLPPLQSQAPYRYVRTPAFLNGGVDHSAVLTGWTGTGAQLGEMSIGRLHVERWRSDDLVERSCAINTVAHEITHLISNRSDIYMMHFVDDYAATLTAIDEQGRKIDPPNAVASYLIGSVAQCTWLQAQRYQPEVDVHTCVNVFGHRGHNGLRCSAFSGGRAIELRDDLPEPYVLVDRQ